MIAMFIRKSESHTVSVGDDLDDATEIVRQLQAAIAELFPEMANSPSFVPWLCDGVLNSLADDRGDILLGELTN